MRTHHHLQCQNCDALFSEDSAILFPVYSKAGRFLGDERRCPECDGTDLECVTLCLNCEGHKPIAGLDVCGSCLAIEEARQDRTVRDIKRLELRL